MFVDQIADLECDMNVVSLAERAAGSVLGPTERMVVGRAASHGRNKGWNEAAVIDLACEIASIESMEPEARRSIIIDFESSGTSVEFASPRTDDDIGLLAAAACTPSAFIGMCLPASSVVMLLESLVNRAESGAKWSHEWFQREAYRLASLGVRVQDDDIALNAFAARVDTVWTRVAVESVYTMINKKQICINPNTLWAEPVFGKKTDGWMFQSWMDHLRGLRWFDPAYFSGSHYRGVGEFVTKLGKCAGWAATTFDGEDVLTITSQPQSLIDWFGCFAIAAAAPPVYDNVNGFWKLPFLPAREGVGVIMVSASLSEHPDSLLRTLRLPGESWIKPASGTRTFSDKGIPVVEIDGESVPIMELTNKQALDNSIFYLYNEGGERSVYWHIASDGDASGDEDGNATGDKV